MTRLSRILKAFKGDVRGSRGIGGFFRSAGIYALGDLLTKGARIILVPYYLANLAQDEVGVLAVLQAIIMATWIAMSLGFGHAIQRYYDEYGKDSEAFVTTMWLARILCSIPVFGFLVAVALFYSSAVESSIGLELLLLAMAAGFFRSSHNLTELWFVIREKPAAYRMFTFFMFLTTTLLTILFISVFEMGVKGAMYAELISYSFWAAVSGWLHFRASLPKWNLVRWSESLGYCLPVLPHLIFMWALAGVDKLIMIHLGVSKADIGVYHIGYLLASVIFVGALAMRSAWLPAFYKQKDPDVAKRAFGRTSSIYFYYVVFAVLCVVTFAPEVVALFSMFGSDNYSGSVVVLRIVAVAMAGFSIFVGFNQPLFYGRKIGIIAATSGFGLLLNVGMNYLLVPRMGINGAALATVVSYSAIGAIVMVLVTRLYGIPWQIPRLVYFAATALLFGSIALAIPGTGGTWAVVAKSALILVFVGVSLFKMEKDSSSRWRVSSRLDLAEH